MSLVSRSTVRLSSPFSSSFSSCSWKPSVASSSTRCELSLFFRIDSIADRAPTVTLIGVAEQHRQLVDHRQVGRVGDDDDERLAVAAVRARSRSAASGRPGSTGTAPGRSWNWSMSTNSRPVALGQAPRLRGPRRRVRRRRRARRASACIGVTVRRGHGSTRVLRAAPSVRRLHDAPSQLEERHVQRQQQAGDDDAHDDEQHRLDQRDEPVRARSRSPRRRSRRGCSASPAARRSTRRLRPSSPRRPGTRPGPPAPPANDSPSRTRCADRRPARAPCTGCRSTGRRCRAR